MNKNYIYIFILFLLFSVAADAQESKNSGSSRSQEPTIERLSLYPNPNNTGKVYISSRLNLDKKVEIFDVLGKKVIDTMLYNKELNVSNLNPGVYIIKINEGEASATRKLIIN